MTAPSSGKPAAADPGRLLVPGYGLVVALGAYTLFAAVLAAVQWGAPEAVFSPWTGVWGIPQFIVWVAGLAIATHAYARRTAPQPAAAGGPARQYPSAPPRRSSVDLSRPDGSPR